jgi:hypothetical protein
MIEAGEARLQGPTNNGMHPTANSVTFVREAWFNPAGIKELSCPIAI